MAKVVSKQLLHILHYPGEGLQPHKLAIIWRAIYDDDFSLTYCAVGLGQDLDVIVADSWQSLFDGLGISGYEDLRPDFEALPSHPVSFDLVMTTLYASRFIEVLRE